MTMQTQTIPAPAKWPETEAQAVERRQSTGFRYKCSFCGVDLPGSNRASDKLSHGMCQPLCEPAIALGYGKYLKG